MSTEKASLKAGAEQGKQKKKSIKLLLEQGNVRVFIAGLPVPADMRTFMRIKSICCS